LTISQEAKLLDLITDIAAADAVAHETGLKGEKVGRKKGLKWRLQEMRLVHLEELLQGLGVITAFPDTH
jgi:hypothetical protein